MSERIVSARLRAVAAMASLAIACGSSSGGAEPAPAPPASTTAPPASTSPPAPSTNTVAPLEAADFPAPLSRAEIRPTNANLAEDIFEKKWQASLGSVVTFMRSYPGAYWADLARVDAKRIPGPEGLSLGDPHPDNFGFLRLNGPTKYVVNDLDDSGYGSVAVDAARYFTILRLSPYASVLADALKQYVEAAFDAARDVGVDPALVPDLDAVARKALDKATSAGKLKLSADVLAPTSEERQALSSLVASDARLAQLALADAAVYVKADGGSGGLRRYWLLVDGTAGRTLLELKEAVVPGAELGRHTKTLGADERLSVLTSAFWGVTPATDYFYVNVLGARFLVRDRLPRQTPDLSVMTDSARAGVILAQASLLAATHRPAWKSSPIDKSALSAWLDGSSRTLAARWQAAFAAAR